MAKESIFTGLNNLKVFSVTSVSCCRYFGFTEDAVRRFLADYGLESKLDAVREWHGGYWTKMADSL